ncbi:hypothetical protein B0A49_12069, partial [Cryomyces minteri]
MLKLKKGEHLARTAEQHGRYIFIYNNLQTNQVVYSLDRSMNVGLTLPQATRRLSLTNQQNHRALKQIAFVGKQTVPSKLRKDVWTPLVSVTFPSPPQGLNAYRRLCELRKLHQLSWDVPGNTSDALPPKRKPKLIPEPDEKPFDKTKLRKRLLMDEKAYSIADLASTLVWQENKGRETQEERTKEAEALVEMEQEQVTKEEAKIMRLAKRAAAGELTQGAKAIAKIERRIRTRRVSDPAKEKERLKKTYHDIKSFRLLMDRMKEAQTAVQMQETYVAQEALKTQEASEARKAEEAQEAAPAQDVTKAQASAPAKAPVSGASHAGDENDVGAGENNASTEEDAAKKSKVLELARERAAEWVAKYAARKASCGRHGKLRELTLGEERPVMTMDGVRIQWADVRDAEYAEKWPEAVGHEEMNYFRHTAPHPSSGPKPTLTEEEEEQMEENVTLDGEVGEESKEGETEREGEEGAAEREGEDQEKPLPKQKRR